MSHRPLHVALVISSLRGGGAERVATIMARGFVDRGLQVTLVTLLDPADDFYTVPQSVQRVSLDLGGDRPGLHRALLRNSRRLGQITEVSDVQLRTGLVLDGSALFAPYSTSTCWTALLDYLRMRTGTGVLQDVSFFFTFMIVRWLRR